MNSSILLFILYYCVCLERGQHGYIRTLKRIRSNFFKLSQVSSKMNAAVKTYMLSVQSTKLLCSSGRADIFALISV